VIALLFVGSGYGFKIVERSSKGYLIPSDYGLTDETAVGALLPYKFAGLIVAFAVIAVVLNRLLGAFDLAALIVLGVVFAALMPAASIRLVTTGSLRSALSTAEIFGVVRKIGKPYAALSGFVFAGVLGGLCALYLLGVLGHSGADLDEGGIGRYIAHAALLRCLLVLRLCGLRRARLRAVSARRRVSSRCSQAATNV
jgi:hypothetical protein